MENALQHSCGKIFQRKELRENSRAGLLCCGFVPEDDCAGTGENDAQSSGVGVVGLWLPWFPKARAIAWSGILDGVLFCPTHSVQNAE